MEHNRTDNAQNAPSRPSVLGNNKGFTLIELAIVLVIIGLILGSVLKGKDLINSAKQKNFYSNFVKTWELSVASYFDRTGYMLGDGTANGGTIDPANGVFDNVNGANFGLANGIDATLKRVGLEVPTSNTANSGQMSFSGAYSGNRTVSLYLYNLYSHTDLRYNNRLYFTAMPTDLAIAIDKMVDGQIDPTAGSFRRYPDNSGATWPDASVNATIVVNASLLINLP